MTKTEVDAIIEAIRWIETGRAEAGVAVLRRLIVAAGKSPPPPLHYPSTPAPEPRRRR